MYTSTSHLKAVPTYCLEFTFNCVNPAWLLRPFNRYLFYLRLGSESRYGEVSVDLRIASRWITSQCSLSPLRPWHSRWCEGESLAATLDSTNVPPFWSVAPLLTVEGVLFGAPPHPPECAV
uniref:Uncharacterized protein n=1 Tax=Echinococcus granulosus TaxID=6210 RepID=A0A068WHT0_ECHGR|nr:hypothetical protein EgrG_001082200 [Echinococcus granulosus]